MNKTEKAAEVAKHMQDVRKQVTDAVKDAPKPKVYLEFSPGWTVGKGEFLDEVITLAGGTNIADKTGWYQIDPELVVKANPDIIVYASMTVKQGEKNPILAEIEKRPGWETINAIKNKKLFEVDQDPLVRVSPRLADGLLEVAKKLHPDLIK
jgi:iron complex transport system substrate-binding protein